MTRLWIPEEPLGYRNVEASAIRAPAISATLPAHAAMRVNWLLARGASLILEQWWPTAITDLDTRVYHRRSANAKRLFIVALIERASSAPGSLAITPAGGSTYTKETSDTAATTPWGDPQWEAWIADLPLTNTGLQYHTVATTDLRLRYLAVLELVRGELDTATDTMVELASGSYAGLEAGRWICDGSVASVADILAGIASAKDATKRHLGGVIFDTGTPWAVTGKTEKNVADPTLATADFYFPVRSRMLRADDTHEHYDVRVQARHTAEGSAGTLKVTGSLDSVSFTSLTSSWAWYSPDGNNTLDIACTGDKLTPTGWTDDNAASVEVASVQFIPT